MPARFLETETLHYPLHGEPIVRFGEWLVRRGLISRADLFVALHVADRHAWRLGDALVWLDTVDRQRVEREARRFDGFRA
jgi:hypothetical protein